MTNEHINLFRTAKVRWLYPIYVPSAFRAGTAPLLNMLRKAPDSVKAKVTIVTLPAESEAYAREYPWARIITEREKGIGPARMRCLVDADVLGHTRIVMLDDDIIHVSLLERQEYRGKLHTRRYSSNVTGIPEPMVLIRALAVGCWLSNRVFAEVPWASYGAARNALFSGDVDPSVGATIDKGSFPACVMFFDVQRFSMRTLPRPYRLHGEDLAMFLHNMTEGMGAYTLPGVAYDQHGSISTTIPLDPEDEVGRPHLETTEQHYPDIHPYLRVAMKNKLGGVKRIGVNWKQWYKDGGSATELPLTTLIDKEI